MNIDEDLPYKEILSTKKLRLALHYYKNPETLTNQGTRNFPNSDTLEL